MPHSRSSSLAPGQMVVAAVLGVALWLVGAMAVRWLIPAGALDGSMRALTYALLVPATAPFVWLVARVARLGQAQVVPAVALVTAAATLCDGIALGWFPGLYAADDAGGRLAGGVILWGGGVGLALAFVMARWVARD